MIRNGKKIAGFMILGVVLSAALSFGAQSMLRWQARNKVKEDLQLSAQVMLERAADATQSAIDVLGRIGQMASLSCTADHRFLYSKATRATPWIDMIGLVDRGGNLVCTDMGQSSRQTGLLSNYKANAPEVNLSLSDAGKGQNGEEQTMSLLVIRHVGNGRRLVARVPGDLVKVDPVRNDLRRYRTAMMSLGNGNPWYILEPLETGGAVIATARERSDFMPFDVHISMSEAALDVVTADGRRVVTILGFVMGFFSLIAAYHFGRFRPDEGDKILDALDRGEFVPFMQPIIDLRNGKIIGCEVLARWNKPDGSFVPPHEFIPLAQNYHLTREVTHHIMEVTCTSISPLMETRPDFKVSFNLFSGQLSDDSIVSDIRDVFHDQPLGYGNLVFEISDRVPLDDKKQAKDIISQIQALGSEIALDDVGSGHSGLYNLTEIGVDILKLDKLMVDSLKAGFAGMELVRSLIDLAENLNIGVIAEGIESEAQVAQLKSMGVSAAQGYLFSPALPVESLVALIQASRSAGARQGAFAAVDDGSGESLPTDGQDGDKAADKDAA